MELQIKYTDNPIGTIQEGIINGKTTIFLWELVNQNPKAYEVVALDDSYRDINIFRTLSLETAKDMFDKIVKKRGQEWVAHFEYYEGDGWGANDSFYEIMDLKDINHFKDLDQVYETCVTPINRYAANFKKHNHIVEGVTVNLLVFSSIKEEQIALFVKNYEGSNFKEYFEYYNRNDPRARLFSDAIITIAGYCNDDNQSNCVIIKEELINDYNFIHEEGI